MEYVIIQTKRLLKSFFIGSCWPLKAHLHRSCLSTGVGVAAAPSSGGTWGAAQTSYKGMGAPARSRLAAERPHPYQPAGRGAPRY